ncbi:MAG: adenylyltransferase/cytidyltransferase family protein [Elusimicrobiota bacterium]|jgi:D-beta-D-heptose 7-phosphate kinase/D-beta-D-heptose 1-phosphate adenosyltransferase
MPRKPIETAGKVCSLKDLLAQREAWKKERAKVVFTNGVYDLLHAGHVEYLEKAAALGDRLVVGVNTDASARRLDKGPERPLNALEDRARLIAALACVSCVVAFDEDTPEQLVAALKPEVLVKGGDYKPSQVAGRKHAGRVVIIPLKRGYSTTNLVSKIRRANRKA